MDESDLNAELSAGFYTGIVTDTSPANHMLRVTLDGQNRPAPFPALWCWGHITAGLGLKESFLPSEGSRVILYYTPAGMLVALGSVPSARNDAVGDWKTAAGGPPWHREPFKDRTTDTQELFRRGHKPPVDLTEGEIDMTNVLGVGIQALQFFASVKAGDLAKIETILFENLVRIISWNFRHVSSLGDFRIVNDGPRTTLTFEATGHAHEAWNLDSPQEEKFESENINRIDPVEEPDKETARFRLKMYAGFAGDFLNLYLHEPVQQLAKIAEDSPAPAGMFRAHLNSDGTFLMQSVRAIGFEKTPVVPIPVRIRRDDDPEGNTSDETEFDQEFLRQWKSGEGHLFYRAYQLREYARHFANRYSLARVRQLSKDYRMPSEEETPRPSAGAMETDRQSANAEPETVYGYACMRILDDGSIVHHNVYGCAVALAGPDVQVCATRDLLLQAGRNVNITGRDVHVRAKRNFEVCADEGGIIIRGKKWLKWMCDIGGILVRTDQATRHPDFPKHHDPGETPPEPEDPAYIPPEHLIDGVQIEARRTHVAVQSRNIFFKTIAGRIFSSTSEWLVRALRGINVNESVRVGRGVQTAHGLSAQGMVQGRYMAHSTQLPGGEDGHLNHVGTLGQEPQHEEALKDPDFFGGEGEPGNAASFSGAEFRHRADAEYQAEHFESLTQQFIRNQMQEDEEERNLPAEYEPWVLASNPSGGTYPWPGGNSQTHVFNGGHPLYKPAPDPEGGKWPEQGTPPVQQPAFQQIYVDPEEEEEE